MSDSESVDDDQICTECPTGLEYTKQRFQAPCMLSQAWVPCLILGVATLTLVFGVPKFGTILHIVVADRFIELALDH
ncbi:hypothetical protein D9619_004039 [Psilocybe cf. subviscida]|uniref:Uncharacterized protein n=1 Tax=Psilocybe cf. subviscida TaxID=2480587 RepID=A0A8H5BQ47_9AGAR|nr:hypothetical protein D9619_004039 [Psilocybe cf. subviscida]